MQQIKILEGRAVVTAGPDFHPLRELNSIGERLCWQHFEGIVFLDLLFFNGLAQNRFVSLRFNGQQFDQASLLSEPRVPESVRRTQDARLRSDRSFLEASVLSSEEIERFTRRDGLSDAYRDGVSL